MMKRFCTILLAIAAALVPHAAKSQDLAHAQDTASMSRAVLMEERVQEIITDAQLDTINVKKKLVINDYAMIGFQYGVGLSQVMWNPKQKQDMLFVPVNAGVTVTKYAKMFGFLPYFGFQAGLFYAREGYRFKYDKDNDYTYTVEGAEKAIMDVIEVPLLLQCHVDLWNFKFMVNLGCYGGYRLAIERFPGKSGSVAPEVQHSFLPTDRRWDYGIKGGVGFGLVFDPVEIHIQAMYKHSMSTLYNPDYYSEYYSTNIVISAGVHFQITKRTGKTKAQLKKMARDMVYQTNENISINGND